MVLEHLLNFANIASGKNIMVYVGVWTVVAISAYRRNHGIKVTK
jgi:hypothetical protein